MAGEHIVNATYVAGDSTLGDARIMVKLVAYPAHLTVEKRFSDQALLSIPWTNLRQTQVGHVDKDILRKILTNTFTIATIIIGMPMGSEIDRGMYITYYDSPVQRDQSPFFAIRASYNKLERIMDRIWAHRDRFVRGMDSSSHPERR